MLPSSILWSSLLQSSPVARKLCSNINFIIYGHFSALDSNKKMKKKNIILPRHLMQGNMMFLFGVLTFLAINYLPVLIHVWVSC